MKESAYGDLKDWTRRTLLIKYCVITHLILPNIENVMDTKGNFFQWFIKFLIKRLQQGGTIKTEITSNKELPEGYNNQLLEPLRKEKYTHLL